MCKAKTNKQLQAATLALRLLKKRKLTEMEEIERHLGIIWQEMKRRSDRKVPS